MNNVRAPMVSFGWSIGWRSGNCSTIIWLSGITLVLLIANTFFACPIGIGPTSLTHLAYPP